ncbi:hypothetical protein CCHOA_07035 [Corynebacterium choanae]|uniref:Uncharacterized protein n=1 Tax=Corynebacterium choanae TaxID=1862358 RepID=A0A3G6J7E8_9CORY|nr:hypothetical protein CCHOA_07035 [Corynebacterium choanae]
MFVVPGQACNRCFVFPRGHRFVPVQGGFDSMIEDRLYLPAGCLPI